MIKQLTEIYSTAGMRIRKWTSNSTNVLREVPEEDRGKGIQIDDADHKADFLPMTKVLGQRWDPVPDTLKFIVKLNDEEIDQSWTKRKMTSYGAKIFDPLGLLAPLFMISKGIISKAWETKCDWDDALPSTIQRQWKKWLSTLHHLGDVNVQRPLRRPGHDMQELVIFADATNSGIACVVYLVSGTEQFRHAEIVVAKARLATTGPRRTIPRLELKAMELGVKAMLEVNAALDVPKEKRYAYSDSTDVLWWITASDSKQLWQFTADRVDFFRENVPKENLYHVPGTDNPADIASRGMHADELVKSKLWWRGPDFLITGERPKQPDMTRACEISKEAKKMAKAETAYLVNTDNLTDAKIAEVNLTEARILSAKEMEELDELQDKYQNESHDNDKDKDRLSPENYSSFERYFRLFRCTQLWRLKTQRNSQVKEEVEKGDNIKLIDQLDEEELTLTSPTIREYATRAMIRKIQMESLPRTLKELTLLTHTRINNPLIHFRPRLDEYGLIRSDGRLRNQDHLPFDQRCPYILNKDHPIVTLIFEHIHRVELKHFGGPTQLLAAFNTRFKAIGAKITANKVNRNCVECRIIYARKRDQALADLPKFRIPGKKTIAPFQDTGVDLFGPIHIRRGRKTRGNSGTEKRWCALFTCMRYRCVHIEVVENPSLEAFAQSFTRFLSRRPRPKTIYSDHGTNFLACKNLLDDLQGEKADFEQKFPDIRWVFSTTKAPRTGGAWERMIGLVKQAFYLILNEKFPTEMELYTIMVSIEGMLNRRPLTAVTTQGGEYFPLTPNDFLAANAATHIAEAEDLEHSIDEKNVRNLIKITQTLEQFWKRLIDEYVVQLDSIPDINRPYQDLQIGDVVILLQNKDRGRWPLARIEGLRKGQDGLVRTVYVRLNGKVYQRPAYMIEPLPMVNNPEKDNTDTAAAEEQDEPEEDEYPHAHDPDDQGEGREAATGGWQFFVAEISMHEKSHSDYKDLKRSHKKKHQSDPAERSADKLPFPITPPNKEKDQSSSKKSIMDKKGDIPEAGKPMDQRDSRRTEWTRNNNDYERTGQQIPTQLGGSKARFMMP